MNKNELLSNIKAQINDFDLTKFRDIRQEFLECLEEVVAEEEFTSREKKFLETNPNIVEKCFTKFDKYCLRLNDTKYTARDVLSNVLHDLRLDEEPSYKKHNSDEEM